MRDTEVLFRWALAALFSVLDASDKFSRASYVSAAVPRNSLRSERRAFAGILLLICVSWQLPWAMFVMCSDASGAGLGFAIRPCEQQNVASVGRILEHTCFRSTGGPVRAPDHAHSSLVLFSKEEDGDEDRGYPRNS